MKHPGMALNALASSIDAHILERSLSDENIVYKSSQGEQPTETTLLNRTRYPVEHSTVKYQRYLRAPI